MRKTEKTGLGIRRYRAEYRAVRMGDRLGEQDEHGCNGSKPGGGPLVPAAFFPGHQFSHGRWLARSRSRA